MGISSFPPEELGQSRAPSGAVVDNPAEITGEPRVSVPKQGEVLESILVELRKHTHLLQALAGFEISDEDVRV